MKIRLCALLLCIATPAFAQQSMHHHPMPDGPAASPYVGMQGRAVKALSEQQTAGLRTGKGMAMALPAELNGYPGPAHVLELAQPLGLNEEQKSTAQKLFTQMQTETISLGEAVITAEAELDRIFSSKTVTPASLQAAVDRAARAQGQLRAAHLRYHLDMNDALSAEQRDRYARLRGY